MCGRDAGHVDPAYQRAVGQALQMFKRRKRSEGPKPSPSLEETYRGIRTMALEAGARGLAAPSPDHPDVSGVVVDIPAEGGFATVVALSDNTTSMYTSTGGGTIGAGEHAEVASATQRLLVEVQRNLGLFSAQDDHELPPLGFVRFHVLNPSTGMQADLPEGAFWGKEGHELMPVITLVQDVISAIRAVSPT